MNRSRTFLALLALFIGMAGSLSASENPKFEGVELTPNNFFLALSNPGGDFQVRYIKWAVKKNYSYCSIQHYDTKNSPLDTIFTSYPTAEEPQKAHYKDLANFFMERGGCFQEVLRDTDQSRHLGQTVLEVWRKAAQAVADSKKDDLESLVKQHRYLVMYPHPETQTTLLDVALAAFNKDKTESVETFRLLMNYGADYRIRTSDAKSAKDRIDESHPAHAIFTACEKSQQDALQAVRAQDIRKLDELLKVNPLLVKIVLPQEEKTLLHIAAKQFSEDKMNSVQMFSHLIRCGADYNLPDTKKGTSVADRIADGSHAAAYLFSVEKAAIEASIDYGKDLFTRVQTSGKTMFAKLVPYKWYIGSVLCIGVYLLTRGSSEKNNHVDMTDTAMESLRQL